MISKHKKVEGKNQITKTTRNNFEEQREVNVLVNNDLNNRLRYEDIKKQAGSFPRAVNRFRKILFEEGRGQVDLEELKDAYYNENHEQLRLLLQEMFLQYIDEGFLDIILLRFKRSGNTIEQLYQAHQLDKNIKILGWLNINIKNVLDRQRAW